jgi:hypothetical protein
MAKNDSFEAAERILDLLLTKSIFIVKDKELIGMTLPYTTCHTLTLFQECLDMMTITRDFKLDDKFIDNPTDAEEPLRPAIDNIAVARQCNKQSVVDKHSEQL